MRPHVVCFAVALVSDLGMFALGRYTRQTPAVVHETELTAESTSIATSATAERAAAVSAVAAEVTRWRTRTVYRHDGTVAATVVSAEKADTKTNTTQSISKEAHASASEHVVTVFRDRTTIQLARPRWMLGISASRGLDGRTGYGPTAGLRLLGPVWLTGGVDVGARSGTVGLSVAF